MATSLQERVFTGTMQAKREGRKVNMGEIMRKEGASDNYANNPHLLTNTKGWQMLKEKYASDEKALTTLNDLADKTNDDKDNRLKASIEILKLNDRYPAQKSKVIGLFGTLDELED